MLLYKNLSSLGLSIVWGAVLMGTVELSAQSRRRGQNNRTSLTVKVDTQALRDSLDLQYEDYRFIEARKSYEQLNKALLIDTVPDLVRRRQQLERAERMLTRVEPLKLLASSECDWRDLEGLFAVHASEDIAKQLRFTVDSLGGYQMEQVVSIDGYRWRLVAEGYPSNLVRKERRAISEEETAPLGDNINHQDANEAFGFILSDGIKLLFASNNQRDGLGGYDLYFSRYNVERKDYLEPTLIPMPFNSPSNDYLFICDEDVKRSYLVSDRDASVGKVRFFVFDGVPQFISGVHSEDIVLSVNREETLKQARLREAPALVELSPIPQKQEQETCFLPLNDDVVIRRWAEFTSAEAMDLYRLYLEEDKKLKTWERTRLDPQAIQALRQEQAKRIVAVKNTEIRNRMK